MGDKLPAGAGDVAVLSATRSRVGTRGRGPRRREPFQGDPWARLSGHGTPVGRAVGKGKRPLAPSCFLRAGAPGPVVFAGCRDSLPRRGLAQPRASASFSFALGPLPPHPQPRGAPTPPQAARTPLPWGPGGIVPSPVLPLGAGSWGWGAEQGGDTPGGDPIPSLPFPGAALFLFGLLGRRRGRGGAGPRDLSVLIPKRKQFRTGFGGV